MSEGAIEGQGSQVQESQEVTEPVSQGQESTGTGINPAWNELLESVPAGLHSQITPHLTKWDQNYQRDIQQVHSQYEPFKPFIENEVNPEQINYALGILSAIEERPEEVLQALRSYIGEEEVTPEQQGLEDNQNGELPEFVNHPEYQRMQQMVDTMAQLLVQQRQSETDSQFDQELDSELSAAQEQHGEFDEEWVLTKLYNNPELSVDEAVAAYKEFEQGLISRTQKPGPPVLGSGGSVPNPDFNPAKLDGKDRRATVAQILAQAAQQNH